MGSNKHKFTKEFLIEIKKEVDIMLYKLEGKYFTGDYIAFEHEQHDHYNIRLHIKALNESKFTNE